MHPLRREDAEKSVHRADGLLEVLERTGYSHSARHFTPFQLALVLEHLGEPYAEFWILNVELWMFVQTSGRKFIYARNECSQASTELIVIYELWKTLAVKKIAGLQRKKNLEGISEKP